MLTPHALKMELDIIGESSRGAYPVVTTVDRKPMFTVYGEREKKGSKGELATYKHEVCRCCDHVPFDCSPLYAGQSFGYSVGQVPRTLLEAQYHTRR